MALEAEVATLQDRLRELELERTQHRAQLETLSRCVSSGGGGGGGGEAPPADSSSSPAQARPAGRKLSLSRAADPP